MKRRPIFFMHIPKSAGSSVNRVFIEHFGSERAIDHCTRGKYKTAELTSFSFFSGHVAWPTIRQVLGDIQVYKFSIMRNPIDHLISHLRWIWRMNLPQHRSNYDKSDPKIKSVVDRLRNFDLGSIHEIEKFLDTATGHEKNLFYNGQARYFTRRDLHGKLSNPHFFDCAIKNFLEFDFVGTVESLEASIERVAQANGLTLMPAPHDNRNDVPEKIRINDEARDRLGRFVPVDSALYALAAAKLQEAVACRGEDSSRAA